VQRRTGYGPEAVSAALRCRVNPALIAIAVPVAKVALATEGAITVLSRTDSAARVPRVGRAKRGDGRFPLAALGVSLGHLSLSHIS
jgi:hypothetical protein